MLKEFKIEDKVFKTNILFIVNCSQDEFQKRIKKYGIKIEKNEYVCGTVIQSEKYFFRIVWSEKFIKKPENIAEFVHELAHLVVRILNDKGVPIKANIETGECGDETFSYLLEFYTRECLKKLWQSSAVN